MSNNNRELTGKEKRQIKKLITSLCASYDKEYGCLPLDCDCPMFGICYTNSGLCSYFRESVLPAEPELQAVFESQPLSVCEGRQTNLLFGKMCRRSPPPTNRSKGTQAQRKAFVNTSNVTILPPKSLVPQGFSRSVSM